MTRADAAAVDVIVTNADADLGAATSSLGVAVAPKAPSAVTVTRDGTTATVAWAAVPKADNGGAPITGYTVSVAKPADSGIEPQDVDAKTTKATFTGLDGASDYTFQVVATNAAGLASPEATSDKRSQSGAATELSIRHSTGKLRFHRALRLSGTLVDAAGTALGARRSRCCDVTTPVTDTASPSSPPTAGAAGPSRSGRSTTPSTGPSSPATRTTSATRRAGCGRPWRQR